MQKKSVWFSEFFLTDCNRVAELEDGMQERIESTALDIYFLFLFLTKPGHMFHLWMHLTVCYKYTYSNARDTTTMIHTFSDYHWDNYMAKHSFHCNRISLCVAFFFLFAKILISHTCIELPIAFLGYIHKNLATENVLFIISQCICA